MLRILLLVILSSSLSAQLTYEKRTSVAKLKEVVEPTRIVNDFQPAMIYKQAPKHVDSRLDLVKEEVSRRFPRRDVQKTTKRSVVAPPELITEFTGNQPQNSTPPDNSMAISNGGQIASGVNSNLNFKTEDGGFLRNISLASFSAGLSSPGGKFDPRMIYDPEEDKFIMTWLSGFDPDESNIVICFSETNDLNGSWNKYVLDGSPEGPETWSDYPMISLTGSELMYTINLLLVNENNVPDFWKIGFDKTVIYQIDKQSGYAGADSLTINTWYDVAYDGKPIRNLHPVKSADEKLENDTYFISTRNFAVESDTIFLLHIDGDQTTDPELTAKVLLADTPYGAPPNARQPVRDLATNDARILDAFRIEDRIQFVSNTVDMNSGKAAIYNGYITDLGGTEQITTRILTDNELEYGYPGIAWTGTSDGDDEAIIVAEHTSEDVFPGFSALYQDNARDVSDWIMVKEGKNFLNMIGQGTERWGDYIGCQRKYDSPGIVWTSSFATTDTRRWQTYLAALSRPNELSTEDKSEISAKLKVYPNPTVERFTLEIETQSREPLDISIYDLSGKKIETLYQGSPKKSGKMEFSFDTTPLVDGSYIITAHQGNTTLSSKKLIKG